MRPYARTTSASTGSGSKVALGALQAVLSPRAFL
jgi:hypothetical protein